MLKTIAEAFAQKVQKRIQKPVDENLLKELLNKLLTKLNSEYIYPESFSLKQFADNKIFLELEIEGDWKHDHLYCEHLVRNFCEENNIEILSAEEEVYHEEEETSYSDNYVALHTWELFIETNLEEDLSNKTGKLMIWTKDEDDNDYHSSWIEIPADIDADGFEALLWNNGYEVHDSEEDPDWFDYEDREDEKDNYHFAIELGSAARWWEFTSLEGCLNWFKQGNSNTFNNANKLYPLDKENVKEGWVIYYRPEDGDRVRFIKANDSSFLPEDEKELQKEYVGKIATITYVGSQFVSNDRVGLRFDDGKRFDCSSWQIEPLQKRPKVTEELVNEENLEETYSDEELDKMVGKVYNIRKLDKWYRNSEGLFAHTICTKCGREKEVFLSNLINDPDKYGSCICSDENIDSKIDYAQQLYTGGRKLKSNTSGYTGVSFVKTYKGQPYNKWRAYIEIDGKRTYLGDFTKKKDAVKARKVAAEKGVKWYKDNRNKITRDLRRKTKKYSTSKYRDSKRKVINLKENASDYVPSDEFELYTAGYILENGSYITLDEYHAEEPEFRNKKLIEFSSTHFSDDVAIRIYKQPTEAQYNSLEKVIDSFLDEYFYCKLECDGNGPILYKAYCLYENAIDDDGYTEQVIGNWTGRDLIKIIKKYYQNNEDLILKEK